MIQIQNWADITRVALINFTEGFLRFIPLLLVAIVVFVIGWFISVGIGKLISEILKKMKVNQIFERDRWKKAMEKADIKVDFCGFIGSVVKWILVLVFLLIAVEIMGLPQFADILRDILSYLPNVIIAALIFIVAAILVDIVEKLVRATVEGAQLGYGHIISAMVRWAIWIFAILAILHQLKIAGEFMQILFTGLVAMMVLALGISFGLGGKDTAAEILQNIKKKIK